MESSRLACRSSRGSTGFLESAWKSQRHCQYGAFAKTNSCRSYVSCTWLEKRFDETKAMLCAVSVHYHEMGGLCTRKVILEEAWHRMVF
eukprot:2569920-Rhodomonas_salina.1